MNPSIELSEAVNNLGNALSAVKWPEAVVKQPDGNVKLYDTKTAYKELVFKSMDAEYYVNQLKDCVNELCQKCGNYRESYAGACDECRWKEVKEGFR